jgi:hypothetical protein
VYDQTNPVNMVKFWVCCLCQSIENLLTIFSHLLMPDFCSHFLWLSVNWSSYHPILPVRLDCYVHTSPTLPYCLLHCHTYGYFQDSVLSPLLSFFHSILSMIIEVLGIITLNWTYIREWEFQFRLCCLLSLTP